MVESYDYDTIKYRNYTVFTVGLTPQQSQQNTMSTSFQLAFKKHLQSFQKRNRESRRLKKFRRLLIHCNPNLIQIVRIKFVEQAKAYIGTPNAKKYWKPEDPEYVSDTFLDCCGLVRRIQADMRNLFGFNLGPWNQAYMFDTLPENLDRPEDMKPGDLVFISGSYVNEKSRPQKHDIVHVEIWLGEGVKTIGARWQQGKVQVFDNIRFEAKSFHSPIYHFKSIDTWLQGICKSFCHEHKWKRQLVKKSKKSIFVTNKNENQTESEVDCQGFDENHQSKERTNMAAGNEGIFMDSCLLYSENIETCENIKNNNNPNKICEHKNNASDRLMKNELFFFKTVTKNESCIDLLDFTEDLFSNCGDLKCEGDCNVIIEHGIDLEKCMQSSDTYSSFDDDIENIRSNRNTCDGQRLTEKCVNKNNTEGDIDDSINILNWDLTSDIQTHIYSDLENETKLFDMTSNSNNQNKYMNIDASELDVYKMEYSERLDCGIDCGYMHRNIGIYSYSDDCKNSGKSAPDFSNGLSQEPYSESHKSVEDQRDDPDESGDRRRRGRRRETKSIPPLIQAASQPQFYVGGGNGSALVVGPLVELGWKRTTDKYNENYKLKWVECKSKINYSSFREGEQLVNHIPNCQILTNKLGLLTSLREYEALTINIKGRAPLLKMSDFFPETYNLNNKNDRELFFKVMQDDETWICKPSGMNQGKGIYLVRSRQEIIRILKERDLKQQAVFVKRPFVNSIMPRIIQRYITNPLLLEERKFDLRAYMLVASTSPFVILYHKGYVRLSCNKYNGEDENLTTHLTNQYIQKKDPTYKEVKEDTAWSMEKLNDYVNKSLAEEKGLEVDWVNKTLTKQMQKIIIHCFQSVKNKLQTKVGYFDLYGLDFMIDTNMKVWLIEINVNPALHINCEALKDVIPGVVEETLHLSIECFEKSRRHQPVFPLKSLQNFTLLNVPNVLSHSSPTFGVTTRRQRGRVIPISRLVSTSEPRLTLRPARDHDGSPDRNKSLLSRSYFTPSKMSQLAARRETTLPQLTQPLHMPVSYIPPSISIQFKLTHAQKKPQQDHDRSDRGN